MLHVVSYFLLNQWLWTITWGIYHIPLNIFFMYVLLRITNNMGKLHLFLLTVGANFFSAILYSAFVVGVLVFGCGMQYLPNQCPVMSLITRLQASLSMGVMYALIQSGFFLLIPRKYSIYWLHALGFAILSNLLTGLMVYKMLPGY